LIFVKLKRGGTVNNEINGNEASHPKLLELRPLAQLGRQPFEPIVVDLKHKLEITIP
jgi:hypothetical protein